MGNGFQFFDIVLFAMIAVFLILRLRSVLGRRDDAPKRGHADPFARVPDKTQPDDNVIALPGRKEPRPADVDSRKTSTADLDPSIGGGVEDIRRHDPSFDPREFAAGARSAFEMILMAFAAGESKTLKPLLSPEVFGNFDTAIGQRTAAGQTLESTLVSIRSADVIEAWMEGRVANVTVKFVSEQIHVLRDKDGQVLEGDPNTIADVTDIWTFARDTRSRDPNWSLVATRSPN